MPTIEGSIEESGRIIVVDETTGAIDSSTAVSAGGYSVTSSSLDPKIVLFRRASDGNTLGYSGITSIDDTPFLGAQSTYLDGVTLKYGQKHVGVMIGNSRFIVIFRNSSPRYMYYTIGTISGESVSFTNIYSLLNGELDVTAFYDHTYEKLFIFTVGQYGHYRISTISGDTVNLGASIEWPAEIKIATISKVLYNEITHTLLVVYKTSDYKLRAIAATFDGNSFTFGTYASIENQAGSAYTTVNLAYDSSSGGYFMVYHLAQGTANVTMLGINVRTVTLMCGKYSSGKTSYVSTGCCCSPSRNLFFISVWYDGQWSDTHTVISFSRSGAVLTKLHQYDIGGSQSDANPILLYDEPSDKLMFIVDAGTSTRRYRLLNYNISTGFSVSSTVTFSSTTIYNPDISLDSSTGKRVMIYGESGSLAGRARVFRL